LADSVFLVTNRAFRSLGDGGYRLEDRLSRKGAKELRCFEARPEGPDPGDWHLDLIPDRPGRQARQQHGLPELFPEVEQPAGSHLLAARVVRRLWAEGTNLLLFVHGYNNTADDALTRAWRLARTYGVEVVVFSWPANGGGERFLETLHGKASYLSDKSDARASTEALDRMLMRLQHLLADLNAGIYAEERKRALAGYPDNPERRREVLSRALRERVCPFNVSLLAHSMGSYLYKKMLLTSSERLSREVVLDNVILKAPDTNHAEHARWVERIRARRRIYITLNQDDCALGLSALKVGEQQKPRLGSTLGEQSAAGVAYIDFTDYLDDEHSYFEPRDLGRESAAALTGFFERALNGRVAEEELAYRPDSNTYRVG